MRIGATTLPLAGWIVDPQQASQAQAHRLSAIQELVEGYGLGAVELTLDLALLFPQVFDAQFYAAVAEQQQALGFACTAHLPFLWLDPASLNEPIRQASTDAWRRSMALVQAIEIDTYTLHAWGTTTTQIARVVEHPAQRQAILHAVLGQATRSLDALCETIAPSTLCVENLEGPVFGAVWPVLEERGVSICLDVGHLAWEGESELDYLARYGERIRAVHLHDAMPRPGVRGLPVRDHLPLGAGQIDYQAFLRALQATGYGGTVTLEVNSRQDLAASLERIREWL